MPMPALHRLQSSQDWQTRSAKHGKTVAFDTVERHGKAYEDTESHGNVQEDILETIADMQEFIMQFQSRLLSLKQGVHDFQKLGAHDFQKLGARSSDPNTEEQETQDGNDERKLTRQVRQQGTEAAEFEGGVASDTNVVRQVRMAVEEPEALRLHLQNQQEAAQRRSSDAHVFIRASAFGQQEEEQKFELRMNPTWIDLTTKSNRVLLAAANLAARRASDTSQTKTNSAIVTNAIKQIKSGGIDIDDEEPTWASNALDVMRPASPHSFHRIAWDIAGCFMLMVDAFTLPLTLAWSVELSSSTAGQIFLFFSLVFWSCDIIANFNTGIYLSGNICFERKKIAKNYLTGWFFFDLFIVGLDLALATLPSDGSSVHRMASALRNIRGLRALRAVRLLRLLKMRKFTQIIEEIALSQGRPWLLIVMSMIKILLALIVSAHGLSCLWYAIGAAVRRSGRSSWLENTGAADIPAAAQYLHALQWLLTPPAPPPIEPGNGDERLGNLLITVFILIVMGSALGNFTSALQELNAMNSEKTRKRREVRYYLQDNATSMELTSRIMRFVDHKLEMQEATGAVDLSLISASLQMDLYVNQRSSYFEKIPIFSMTKQLFPTVFAQVCGAATKHGFEKNELVFQAGQFANSMVITAVGNYTLLSADEDALSSCQNEDDQNNGNSLRTMTLMKMSQFISGDDQNNASLSAGTSFSGVRWFAETCIYSDGLIHPLTLRANTFCDTFTLTHHDFEGALQDSPTCTYMYCEYAKDFLTALRQCQDPSDYEQAAAVSDTALQQNKYYMELYPDPSALIETFGTRKPRPKPGDQEAAVDREDSMLLSRLSSASTPGNSQTWISSAKLFVEETLNGPISEQTELSEGLRNNFPELDPLGGSHATFSNEGERDRSESSCLSILNLVADQYEHFTRPQNPAVRLTTSQWQELRAIIEWIAPTHEEVHAVVVLLAIRSLGKSKRLVQQVPSRHQRPEAAVIFLINQFKNVVPSVNGLSPGNSDLIIKTLRVHEKFNFAQFLQGENCPANILQFKEIIREDLALLKFYMLFFLGFMSGLAGGQGSRFMTSKTSGGIIDGCRTLMCLMSATPRAIYWTYMIERARALCIPAETPEDLALVRLACLSRAQDYSGYQSLCDAWTATSMRTRRTLVKHFLSDGISERAFVFEFLPLCISNATRNTCVRLPLMLEVIVDLLDNLGPAYNNSKEMAVAVDLSDMAEFVGIVRNRFIFQSCVLRCEVRRIDKRIIIEMSANNWVRTNDIESDTTALANDVKQILDRTELMETAKVINAEGQPHSSKTRAAASDHRTANRLPSRTSEHNMITQGNVDRRVEASIWKKSVVV